MDSIYWSHRSRFGYKYTVAARDEATGYVFHFHLDKRDKAGQGLVDAITALRRDPELNNPELVRRIVFLLD